MAIVLNPSEPAIVRGIKTVGVGKKGSKALTPQLAREIVEDLKADKISAAAQGAFFAGLLAKGIAPEEEILAQAFKPGTLHDVKRLVEAIAPDAPAFVRVICTDLFNHKTLDKKTACRLGEFLFSNNAGDGARGLVASFLRVRYETDDEYEGLLQAIQETITPAFRTPVPDGDPVIQLAEPFDGNDHSYMITPLLGAYVQSLGYRTLHLVGRNSGPKLVFNLLDVVEALKISFVKNNSELGKLKSAFGWFIHQKDLSSAVDRWVDIRRQTVKRPFLATLEKFLNPANAQIIATSAFHPPYGEKMLTISERAGFPGAIVIRNGIEGSLAFSLKRETRILCSARQKDGSYRRHEIIFEAEKFLGETIETEEKREHPNAIDNARLIEEYRKVGKTANRHFDLRVKATCEGFRMAIEWIGNNLRWT